MVGEMGQMKPRAEVAERYRKGMLSSEATLIKDFIVDQKQYLKTD